MNGTVTAVSAMLVTTPNTEVRLPVIFSGRLVKRGVHIASSSLLLDASISTRPLPAGLSRSSSQRLIALGKRSVEAAKLLIAVLILLGALISLAASFGTLRLPDLYVCASVVIAMVTSGYFVGKLMNMYPVESAIVTGCHSGLGGTGDVAILSASGRMGLMPFAQISTRLGGASTVIMAT